MPSLIKNAQRACMVGLSAQCSVGLHCSVQLITTKKKAADEAKDRESAKQIAARAPSKRLALALLKRGWRVAAPQASVGKLLHSSTFCNTILRA